MSTANHTAPNDIEQSARLAHELSNLLDGSMRNVALVRSLMHGGGGNDPGAAAERDVLSRLQTAEQGMRKMATLIRDWMTQHRAVRPIVPAEPGETLGDAINHARDLHHPAATALGIEIGVHVAADAARLPAGRVFTVVANALRNSIEAIAGDASRGKRPGVIEVRAQVQAGNLRVTVIDNGPGIHRDMLDIGGVFRFGETTKAGGHGLGLSLCRDIAATLGGNLRLTNREEGGAQLAFTVPAAQQPATPGQHGAGSHENPAASA